MTIHKSFHCILVALLLWQFGFAQNTTGFSTLDRLHTSLNDATDKQEQVETILALCSYFKTSNTRELDSLSYYANKALKLSDSDTNFQEQKIEALYYLGRHAIEVQDLDKARSYISQIESISEWLSYGVGLMYASKLSGRMSEIENNFNMAFLNYEKAYQITKDYKLPNHIIFNTSLELSRIYLNNRYNKEIVSILLFENIDLIDDYNIPIEDKALFYFYLGFYHDIYKIDYDKTVENYSKSAALYSKINDQIGLVYPLINLAETYQLLGDHDKAIETFNRTLDLDLGAIKSDSDSYIYYGLGKSFLELKDYNTAEYHLKKAAKADRIINDFSGEADCFYIIAEIYLQKGDTKKADSILNRAKEAYGKGISQIRKKNPLDKQIAYNYEQISKIYELKNDYKNGLAFHTLYTMLNDSINNSQNIKVTERFKFLKESSEKKKEIETLENENKIQQLTVEKEKTFRIGLLLFLALVVLLLLIIVNRYRLKQKALKIINQKNEENKLLMREIHHRVKNNLQIISSLLGVQISNSDNDKLKLILQESQNKIKSMSLIHQNLYKGDQFAKVSVGSYVNELVAEIESSYAKDGSTINFNLDISEEQIPIGLAVPLGLILNELITNSFKYAFLDNDTKEKIISIKFNKLDNGTYSLIVKDNGKGMPEDFDLENLSTFGLQLVYGLTEQLHGNINITRNKGTMFSILLKAPDKA